MMLTLGAARADGAARDLTPGWNARHDGRHLQEAFAFDIRMRRDVDERFSREGIRVVAHDIREEKVYESNGVTVTGFLVTHGLVKPSYGYRRLCGTLSGSLRRHQSER